MTVVHVLFMHELCSDDSAAKSDFIWVSVRLLKVRAWPR